MLSFICFSVNNWEKRKARKQQFMLALSKREDVDIVLYVEPPLNFWRLLLLPVSELSTKENRNRWGRALKGKTKKINKKLFIYTSVFFIPFFHRFQWIYNINRYFSYIRVRELLNKIEIEKPVVWLYHPFDYKLIDWFREKKASVFDWAEEWADYFIEFSSKKKIKIKKLEENIMKSVDIVFTVSEDLKNKARQLNSNSYHLFDGTVYEVFQKENYDTPEDIKDIPSPIAGYLGSINERVDVNLMKKIAVRLPYVSFIFIGCIHKNRTNIKELKKYDNIYFIGPKEYKELGDYAHCFDICILPYVTNLFMGFPTKLLDYLATGKPIVTTSLQHLEKIKNYLNIAHSNSEFIDLIGKSLKEKNEEKKKNRLQAAKDNTWEKRAKEIIEKIDKTI